MASVHQKSGKKWSGQVTEHSDALDLKEGVFAKSDPKEIAASLKQSAEHSNRRKSNPFRSAMSMLSFYINRAGNKLSATQRKRLEAAKTELRKDFGQDAAVGIGTSSKRTLAPNRAASKKGGAGG
jgi:Protein of unknown function (DUF3175)